MIWDKIGILRSLFPSRAAALEVSKRWNSASQKNRALAADLIRLGGVMTLQPIEQGEVDITNLQRLAYEAGRRDLALQLLAMMNLTIEDLNTLSEDNDV